MSKVENAKDILKQIGMPDKQQSDLCAYTLLALLGLKNNIKWTESKNDWIRIHDIIRFV